MSYTWKLLKYKILKKFPKYKNNVFVLRQNALWFKLNNAYFTILSSLSSVSSYLTTSSTILTIRNLHYRTTKTKSKHASK